jgi:hypothetical protein
VPLSGPESEYAAASSAELKGVLAELRRQCKVVIALSGG